MKASIHFLFTLIWSVAASATLTIFAAYPLFFALMGPLNLSGITFLSQKTIAHNFNKLMSYLLNPFDEKLIMPDFKTSSEGLKHFSDVKHLFFVAIVVTVILLIPAIRFIKQKTYIRFYQEIKILLVIPLCLIIWGMVGGFDSIFISFHKLLFRDATWLFDPATDPVINILPESYFMGCFILFGIIYFAFWSTLLVKVKRRI